MKALPKLDSILHQPVRTRIVGALVQYGEVSFSDLKSLLDITDGNLDAHMKKLFAAGYLHSRVTVKNNAGDASRSRTLYSLSDSGKEAYGCYLDALRQVIDLAT